MKFRNIGVIGAGTMGISITVDFLLRGLEIVLVDMSEKALEKAKEEIVKGIRFAPLVSKMGRGIDIESIMKKVTFTTHLENIKNCNFIVENITENKQMKQKLYSDMDKICKEDTCFGVNTSCVSITEIGAMVSRQDKVIGIHFMNPVFLKSYVEVIKGFNTSEKIISSTIEFLDEVGKKAIVVEDFPGFVSNRISHLFMNEAAFVVQDQVTTPEKVDEIFKKCYEHKMGPLETADLIGLDTVVNSLDVLYESYQDSKYRCCPLLRKMVHAGLLGKKNGKGFYNYEK